MKIDSLNSLINCSWISVKGTLYKPKTILTLDVCEFNGPNFGIVNKLYFYNNNLIVFQCFKLNTIMFDEHYHSYEVKKEINDNFFVYYNNLASYVPNHICTMTNGNTCFSSKLTNKYLI